LYNIPDTTTVIVLRFDSVAASVRWLDGTDFLDDYCIVQFPGNMEEIGMVTLCDENHRHKAVFPSIYETYRTTL